MGRYGGLVVWAALTLSGAVSCAGRPCGVWLARVDGLVEPTISKPASTYQGERERLELVRRAEARRVELLGKLPPPTVLCRRVPEGSIRIDGRLSPGEWAGATEVSGFRLTRELTPARSFTRALMAWDARYLYVAFECEDADVMSTITRRDGELWREDAVEVFVDADGDAMSYVELEVNPRGLLYDASMADYRPEVDWVPDMVHLDIPLGVRRYDVCYSRAEVRVRGTLNDPSDVDRGWTCEIALAWEDVARGTNVRRLPPRDGDVLRIGLFRINRDTGQEEDEAEYSGWTPTTSWFHVPWLFGRVVFVE